MAEKLTFSQKTQLYVQTKRTAFSVDMVDWNRLREMINNHASLFIFWINISSIGFSASLSIFLTWLSLIGQKTYPYKTHLLIAIFVTITVGILSLIFALLQKKNETFSKTQILKEMDTMQISNDDELQETYDDFKVIKAIYGTSENSRDVTDKLNELVQNNKLTLQVSNALVPSDPDAGNIKTLSVVYQSNGEINIKNVTENDSISLPS